MMDILFRYIRYKWLVPGVALGLAVATGVRAADGFRTFSDTSGRTFKGIVLSLDKSGEVVTIRRNDDKTARMPVSVFSDEDQQYITEWGFLDAFDNQLNILPKLVTTELDGDEEQSPGAPKAVYTAGYEVQLKNESAITFEKIGIEYCMFYRQGEREGDTSTTRYEEGISYGSQTISALKPEDKTVLKTSTVKLYEEIGYQTIFGRIENSKKSVRGLWLKLRIKLPSGTEYVREYRTAYDPYWKWSDYSVGAGLNETGPHVIITVK